MAGYSTGHTRHSVNDVDVQAVAITSVDLGNNIAGAIGKNRTALSIDISHHVGAVQVTPAIGEQWYIEKHRGVYRLKNQIPHNNIATTTTPTQGQVQLGSGSGPIQLHGTAINANAPLRLFAGNSPLPDATTAAVGSLAFDGSVPVFSNGSAWVPLTTGSDGTYYILPMGGVPSSDMSSGVQGQLALAASAYQKPGTGIPAADLATSVQTNLTKASTALQNIPTASVGLSQLNTTGTPGADTFLDGTMHWSLSSTTAQSLLDGLTGIPGALVTDVTGQLGSLVSTLGGSGSTFSALAAVLADIPQGNVTGLVTDLGNLLSVSTWTSFLADANTALGTLGSGVDDLVAGFGAIPMANIQLLAGYLSNIASDGVISGISAVSGLGGYLTNLASDGVMSLAGLANGTLPVGVMATISNVNLLAGYLTNLSSGGVLALTGLASGVLPAGISAATTQITGLLAYVNGLITTGLGAIPSSLISAGTLTTSAISNVSTLLSTSIWNSFVTDANTALSTAGSDLSHLITGLTDNTTKTVSTFNDVGVMLQTTAGQTANDLLSFFRGVFSPWNPPQVIGTGQVANVAQNLLLNPTFESAQALDGQAVWTWDSAHHSTTGGSAKVLANVNLSDKWLLSNLIQVALNDTIQASVWTKWDSLVSTGTPISLMLNLYSSSNVLITEATLQAATITGSTSSWVQLTGSYLIDDASVTGVRLRFDVSTAATAGSVWFNDASLTKPNLIPQSHVESLESDFASQLDKIHSTWDAAWSSVFPGITPPDDQLTRFEQAVAGIGSQITTAINRLDPIAALLSIRDNIPIHFGLGATSEVTLPLAHLGTATQPSNFAVTASTPTMGFVRCSAATLKKVVLWHGAGKLNITDFYISIYEMNAAGDLSRIHTSPNIVSSIAAGWNWNVYDVPDGLQVQASSVYGIELRTVGSGTHTIAGVDLQWMPDYPGFPKRYGASRNSSSAPPDTIAAASVQYSRYTPCFEFAMNAADVPSTDMPAETQHFTAPGYYVVNLHPWAVIIDLIGCGGGGGGGGGAAYAGAYSGEHGVAGSWSARTVVRGVDIPWDTTQLGITVGGGGGGGATGTPPSGGGGGGNTTFVGTSMSTLTAGGGGGGGLYAGFNGGGNPSWGFPGNCTYNGVTYPGGAGGPDAYSSGGYGNWGSGPGGAGGGGNLGPIWGGGGSGGGGAAGAAYIVQRQS